MKPVIYIDVDDTIVRSVGTVRIPMSSTIQKIIELHRVDIEMYCWSSGGAEYAKEICIEFNIDHCFKGFLPKPNIMVDDQEINDWRFLSQHLPNNFSNLNLEDISNIISSKLIGE